MVKTASETSPEKVWYSSPLPTQPPRYNFAALTLTIPMRFIFFLLRFISLGILVYIQTTLFIPTLDTTTKIDITTILLSWNLRLRDTISHKLCKNIVFDILKKHMFWIFVRIASVHRFYEEIRTKHDLSYLSWSILYNSKFILMATSLGTNAIVVTRVHYTLHVFWYVCSSSSFIDSGWLFHFYRLRLASSSHFNRLWLVFPLLSTQTGFSTFIDPG